MITSFSKYSGCGNDFILIDRRHAPITCSAKSIARLCDRHQGIGADGVIFLETSSSANYKMRYFNADGGEAKMCGNGIRCLAKFIEELTRKGELSQQATKQNMQMSIETMHSNFLVSIIQEMVQVAFPPPTGFLEELCIDGYKGYSLDTGVPHFVTFVSDLSDKGHMQQAPKIRFNPLFPQGTNVNFASTPIDNAFLAIRTYERGVEGETESCGTGAVAAALIAADVYNLLSPVTIQTRSNDILRVSFTKGSKPYSFSDIHLTGPAVKVFEGKIALT